MTETMFNFTVACTVNSYQHACKIIEKQPDGTLKFTPYSGELLWVFHPERHVDFSGMREALVAAAQKPRHMLVMGGSDGLVEKTAGDSEYAGFVVGRFTKRSGLVQYVVEDDRRLRRVPRGLKR